MAITYSVAAINARLNGVVSTIGTAGTLKLTAGGAIISSITLANPCGSVAAGVLTFSPRSDPSAAATGTIDGARIEDTTGVVVITGLTVGVPLSGQDIVIANGFNSLLINAGQVVTLLSGQIVGS